MDDMLVDATHNVVEEIVQDLDLRQDERKLWAAAADYVRHNWEPTQYGRSTSREVDRYSKAIAVYNDAVLAERDWNTIMDAAAERPVTKQILFSFLGRIKRIDLDIDFLVSQNTGVRDRRPIWQDVEAILWEARQPLGRIATRIRELEESSTSAASANPEQHKLRFWHC